MNDFPLGNKIYFYANIFLLFCSSNMAAVKVPNTLSTKNKIFKVHENLIIHSKHQRQVEIKEKFINAA